MDDKKIKITLKERRRVCQILAAQAGLDKINNDILTQVHDMDDSAVAAFLNNNLTAAAASVEVLRPDTVEEIRPGGVVSENELYNLSADIIKNFMLSNNWDGEKISPLQWAACCMACGRFFRSRSFFRGLPENENTHKGIKEVNAKKGIDAAAVADAVPVWLSFCYKYNKTPLICDFIEFCGLSPQWLYDTDGPGVSSSRAVLRKTLERIQADGLRRRAINPKESPIGAIFLLKADHGLVEASRVQHEYIKTDASGAALPVFGADAAGLPDNSENIQ